jgi:hypothetical protein
MPRDWSASFEDEEGHAGHSIILSTSPLRAATTNEISSSAISRFQVQMTLAQYRQTTADRI